LDNYKYPVTGKFNVLHAQSCNVWTLISILIVITIGRVFWLAIPSLRTLPHLRNSGFGPSGLAVSFTTPPPQINPACSYGRGSRLHKLLAGDRVFASRRLKGRSQYARSRICEWCERCHCFHRAIIDYSKDTHTHTHHHHHHHPCVARVCADMRV